MLDNLSPEQVDKQVESKVLCLLLEDVDHQR